MATTRTFPRKDLRDLLMGPNPIGYVVVEDRLVDIEKSMSINKLVFSYEDKLYRVTYKDSVIKDGVFEPFDDAPENVVCTEVQPVEVTRIEYHPV